MINNYVKIYINSNGEVKLNYPIKNTKRDLVDQDLQKKIKNSNLNTLAKSILNAQINSRIRK